ncbi:hypothetical protein [Xanthobacter aminoxidans]|uniref:hypothetical protein n=1 Tax=Xanthobacter aminoxidans TaxID=186280 RepID=UPI002022EE27|nr:hypothetical protein [Xanthobacter aminoxidans]MCL8381209.1 hypothetical protein [Xanthobacter aminoxidans]
MVSAIGLRVYKIGAHPRRDATPLPLVDKKSGIDVPSYIASFVNQNKTQNKKDSAERSWYFEKMEETKPGCCRGYIHYGTFGFESNFVDGKTKAKKYKRSVTDVEEIPLYFEFWTSSDNRTALAAFQSFQGRSCINILFSDIQEDFERKTNNILTFKKLLPSDSKGSVYNAAPVKNIKLIKRNAGNDVTDTYIETDGTSLVDFEISISAKRKSSLGALSDVYSRFKKSDESALIYDGVEFSEAYAEIRVGNKLRKIGLFGAHGDAGVIDLTGQVKRGLNGHPTFDSMKNETKSILDSIYKSLYGAKR